jgi:hypothetical protein
MPVVKEYELEAAFFFGDDLPQLTVAHISP